MSFLDSVKRGFTGTAKLFGGDFEGAYDDFTSDFGGGGDANSGWNAAGDRLDYHSRLGLAAPNDFAGAGMQHREFLQSAFPGLNAWELAGSSGGNAAGVAANHGSPGAANERAALNQQHTQREIVGAQLETELEKARISAAATVEAAKAPFQTPAEPGTLPHAQINERTALAAFHRSGIPLNEARTFLTDAQRSLTDQDTAHRVLQTEREFFEILNSSSSAEIRAAEAKFAKFFFSARAGRESAAADIAGLEADIANILQGYPKLKRLLAHAKITEARFGKLFPALYNIAVDDPSIRDPSAAFSSALKWLFGAHLLRQGTGAVRDISSGINPFLRNSPFRGGGAPFRQQSYRQDNFNSGGEITGGFLRTY